MKTAKALALVAGTFLAAQIGMAASDEATATLKPGDAAPKLQVGKWVQGEPVKSFEKDKAYIVEFWATWCGPCRVSIPHLNEIYEKYKDKGLVVIGQDCWEQDESLVEPFVKKMGDKMTYRVALDDKKGSEKGKMAETWMEAAGQNGIPCAFLVNKEGKIAWIGHPMTLKDTTIEKVLAGTFDIKQAAKEAEEQKKNQAAVSGLGRQLNAQLKDKEWDKAEATLGEIQQKMPDLPAGVADQVKLQILLGKGNDQQAAEKATQLSEQMKENPMALNQLAWQMVSYDGIKGEALATAAKIAKQANDATGGKDPAVLDTLARAMFLQGKKDEAIGLQAKAVELSEADRKTSLQKTLDSYKAGKVPEVD